MPNYRLIDEDKRQRGLGIYTGQNPHFVVANRPLHHFVVPLSVGERHPDFVQLFIFKSSTYLFQHSETEKILRLLFFIGLNLTKKDVIIIQRSIKEHWRLL